MQSVIVSERVLQTDTTLIKYGELADQQSVRPITPRAILNTDSLSSITRSHNGGISTHTNSQFCQPASQLAFILLRQVKNRTVPQPNQLPLTDAYLVFKIDSCNRIM